MRGRPRRNPVTRSPGLSDEFVRLQERRARGQPVRPQGAGQHLHPADEPDDRRAGEARRAARRRPRARRAGRGLGHQRPSSTRSSTWPRPATTSSRPATSTAAPTPSSTTSCRTLGITVQVRRFQRSRATSPRPSTTRPAPCSARPSRTRRSRSPTWRPWPRSRTDTACR